MLQNIQLGREGPLVSSMGLGCMGMSGAYGPVDRAEAISTIHAALDAGVNLIDTGDFYGSGHNEMLIGEALRGHRRDAAVLSVKFGALRDPNGGFFGYDGRPAAVRNFLANSLQRLGVEHIDIYRPARLDPNVPIEDTAGAIAGMIQAGYVRHLGLSEVGSETIRRAASVHPVCDLQIEYSLMTRGIEDKILPTCRELGIGVTAYGVLSGGLIGGHFSTEEVIGTQDLRAHRPRFQGANRTTNLLLTAALTRVARRIEISTAQAAIAWVASQGRDIVPLIGARNRTRLDEALGASHIQLTSEDLELIEAAIPADSAAGERYPVARMADLDSEG